MMLDIWVHVCVQKGGREVVVGVRFTLVRLAPLDIPGIPTSGMLEAPPSSSNSSGGCGGLLWRAFMLLGSHRQAFWLSRDHMPSNLGDHGNL